MDLSEPVCKILSEDYEFLRAVGRIIFGAGRKLTICTMVRHDYNSGLGIHCSALQVRWEVPLYLFYIVELAQLRIIHYNSDRHIQVGGIDTPLVQIDVAKPGSLSRAELRRQIKLAIVEYAERRHQEVVRNGYSE